MPIHPPTAQKTAGRAATDARSFLLSIAFRALIRHRPQFWLNLQRAYEIRVAEAKARREIALLPVRAGMS